MKASSILRASASPSEIASDHASKKRIYSKNEDIGSEPTRTGWNWSPEVARAIKFRLSYKIRTSAEKLFA